MEIVRAPRDLRARTASLRAGGSTVGLVLTMGALHAGHGSLIRRARDENDAVVVSIFVNPLQFGPDEDLDRYPRDEAADIAFCQREGVDVIWEPAVDQMYPPGRDLPVPDPGPVGPTFEGAARPGHFAGVLTVVRRLFDVAGPARAYFGEKDAQQLFLVRRMVAAEPALGVEVVACPTIREPDGLALSSRNRFLQGEEREQATCLFLALTEAAERARSGERDAGVLVAVMAREIGATPLARLDYAAVVDEATFEGATTVGPSSRAIVAARFPSARLIDNLLLPTPSAATSG
jgi:pantoate--beta-alanine ligase